MTKKDLSTLIAVDLMKILIHEIRDKKQFNNCHAGYWNLYTNLLNL
jgi:hypothetical protein